MTVVQGFKGGLALQKPTGADVVTVESLEHLHPKDYVIAHLLGLTGFQERQRMYADMLEYGIKYSNDKMAAYALQRIVQFLLGTKETSQDTDKRFFEGSLTAEVRGQHHLLYISVLELFEQIILRKSLYIDQTERNVPDYGDKTYGIRLKETWEVLLVYTIAAYTASAGEWPDRPGHILSVVNVRALRLIARLGTDDTLRKVPNMATGGHYDRIGQYKIDFSVREQVMKAFKHASNSLGLVRVTEWLGENAKTMPDDMRDILRIEFVRKGGALDLKAPPLAKT